MMVLFSLFVSVLLVETVWGINVFSAPAALPTTIPLSCRTALSANITCAPAFITARDVVFTRPLDVSFLQQYCVSGCKTALQTFQSTVATRCGSTVYAFGPAVNQSGSDIANALSWAYEVSCQKDKAGTSFCLSKILNGTSGPCDDCTLKYEAALVGSPNGDRLMSPVEFSASLSSCSVPATSYLVSSRAPTNTTSGVVATPTCDTTTYTVKSGDTCNSIAKANSVGQDLLIARNKLDYNCTNLVVGDPICLGDKCTLHVVQANESCAGIAASLSLVTPQELTSWNPSIHRTCDNLDSMVGRTICVSPPGTSWDIGGNNTAIATPFPFTPFVLPTSKMVAVPGAAGAAPNFTTRYWAVPQTVSAATRTVDVARYSAVAARVRFCPDFSNATVAYLDLPDDCLRSWAPYCNPQTTGTILPSPTSTFPASCSPAFYQYTPAPDT